MNELKGSIPGTKPLAGTESREGEEYGPSHNNGMTGITKADINVAIVAHPANPPGPSGGAEMFSGILARLWTSCTRDKR